MPQPFAVTSKFGQLFMALDSWVTRATVDYLRVQRLETYGHSLSAEE